MATILAIESSCDEMSVAILRNGKELLCNVISSQIDVHKLYGGVVPEIASRKHVESVASVLREALATSGITLGEIDAIAVTKGPGLVGSLHVGMQEAKTLAIALGKPLIGVHHIAGHIYANAIENDIVYPCLALVVSGGHTELVYMKKEFSFDIIGTTFDDAIGEAYDKVGRVLGLPYPGGPVIDALAHEGTPNYPLPKPLDDGSYHFSFSGLKSAVINLVHNTKQRGQTIVPENLAASFQEVAMSTIVEKTLAAARELQVKQVIVAGGVSANRGLREKMADSDLPVFFPPMKYCTDNAAMIAAAAAVMYKYQRFAPLDLAVRPGYDLEEESVG